MLRKTLTRKTQVKEVEEEAGTGERQLYKFKANQKAWVNTKAEDVWRRCVVLEHSGLFLTVKVEGKSQTGLIDLRNKSVYPANEDFSVEANDMTSLRYLNEPCILEYLEKRAYAEEFGTFIGPVLVSVNPMKPTLEPKNIGSPQIQSIPTPYAIAEYAFAQMAFAADNRKKKMTAEFVNQTIISSGESGAGKTESSKKVLAHLVSRAAKGGEDDLNKRLIHNSAIMEAFGNARTLRNDNSSRFGKLLKVAFKQIPSEVGSMAEFIIAGGSVETYLLERSRVSNRPVGEQNFKVFYFLLAGIDDAVRNALYLDKLKRKGYRYLVPLSSATQNCVEASEVDREMEGSFGFQEKFVELEQALLDSGFHTMECLEIYKLVAAVLHLGNVAFVDKTTPEGDIAKPYEVEKGYDPIAFAAELLGVGTEDLERLLLERKVETRGESIVVHRNSSAACFARDAVAKNIYAKLWEYMNRRINQGLGGEVPKGSPFIGVLDIFGFEVFARNDFEQLLINFTNESLQSIFNHKVFQAELALYKSEGLAIDDSCIHIPSNELAMELLAGKLKSPNSHAREYKDAILVDLDQQSREIKPSDEKLLSVYQTKFAKHPNFILPPPKTRHEQFIIKHYAGEVAYTMGSMIEKNNDQLPAEFDRLFNGSTNKILKRVFKTRKLSNPTRKKPSKQTIVRTFRDQVQGMLEMLEETSCFFIRCVKPSQEKSRSEGKWFNRRYVSHQLKHLSIPQTAQVLRAGLPTRVPFEDLVDTYSQALPKEALSVLNTPKEKKALSFNKLFVSALFWAFQIDPSKYKVGHTKVFFRAGDIAILDEVVHQAGIWSRSKDPKVLEQRSLVAKRFRQYFARLMWRRAYIKVVAQNKFLAMYERRHNAAVRVGALARAFIARQKFLHLLESKHKRIEEEKEKQRRKEEEERQAREAERQRILEELQREKLEKLKTQATMRKQSTLERKNSRKLQSTLERQESLARQQTMSRGAKPEITGLKEIDYDSDKDTTTTEESENETDDDDTVDGEHLPHVKEAKRMERYVSEIEKKASERAENEATLRRSKGRKVSTADLEKLKAKHEEQLMEETAEYEALRQHDEDIRDDYFQQLKSAGSKAAGWLMGRSPEEEVGRRLSSKLDKHTEFKETVKMMKKTPYVQGKLKEAERKMSMNEDKAAQNTLTRQATISGDETYKVNEAEVETPLQSAKQMLKGLHEAVERGDITADEFARMASEIAKALGRKSYTTHSEVPDKGFGGVPVMCNQCRTHNNTANGLACQSCNAPLPVDVFDQTDAFRKPDEETWASVAALQFRGGKMFARVVDQVSRYHENFQEMKVFSIECAWQKRPTSKIHTRWIIKCSAEDLETLHNRLHKEGSKAVKHPNRLPEHFPQMKREVERKEKQKGRYSMVRDALFRVSMRAWGTPEPEPAPAEPVFRLGRGPAPLPPGEPPKESAERLSNKEYIQEVQKWLGQIFDAGSESNTFNSKPKGTNLIFKGIFGTFFRVGEHVDALLRARGR